MLYIELAQPRSEMWAVVQHTLSTWGNTNTDGTGISWINKKGQVKLAKLSTPPDRFFNVMGTPPKTLLRLAGHVRAATAGKVNTQNTHPFRSCDGKMTLMHNGILSNWEPLKKILEATGHKFSSDTDSEVLLHVMEEFGVEEVVKVLNEHKVCGSMNFILMTEERTYAFSDGSLYMLELNDGKGVGFFSDMHPFPSKVETRAKYLRQGTLSIIEDGKVTTKDLGTIGGSYVTTWDAKDYKDFKEWSDGKRVWCVPTVYPSVWPGPDANTTSDNMSYGQRD